MKFKSWEFGKRARSLPVVNNLADWNGSGVLVNREVEPSVVVRRMPSRMVPETLAAIVKDPRQFLVKKRRDWDIHKISRLQAGEVYRLPATRELVLESCWVHIPSGMVISADREVLASTSHAPGCFYQGHSDVDWEDAPWIEEECFLIATVWGANYAHWLMDALPRLSGVEMPNGRLLLGREVAAFQKQSLALLGFSPVDFEISSSSLVRCRRLRVHVAAPASGVPHPICLEGIRRRIRPQSEASPVPGRRLYISRQLTRRKVLNHGDIQPVLDEFGFETVDAASLSFEEQVRQFASAEAILGVHGAGTMNALFAPAGARLIEIFNPMVWDHAAHRVASLCGVSHFHCFAENANRNFEVRLDPQILRRTLALAWDDREILPPEQLIEKDF